MCNWEACKCLNLVVETLNFACLRNNYREMVVSQKSGVGNPLIKKNLHMKQYGLEIEPSSSCSNFPERTGTLSSPTLVNELIWIGGEYFSIIIFERLESVQCVYHRRNGSWWWNVLWHQFMQFIAVDSAHVVICLLGRLFDATKEPGLLCGGL